MTNEPKKPQENRQDAERRIMEQSRSTPMQPGYYSNQILTRRNGGVRHQFADDIGGCSANYR